MDNCTLSSLELYRELEQRLAGFTDWTEEEVREIKKLVGPNSTTLDIGCGWGREVKEIAPVCRKVVGVEIDPQEIAQAQAYLRSLSNIELLMADAAHIPLSNENFDLVLSVGNTFGNLNSRQDEVLQEMKRLAKKGGRILVSVFSQEALPYRVEAYRQIGLEIVTVEADRVIFEDGYVSKGYTAQELKLLFAKAGLEGHCFKLGAMGVMGIASEE